MQPSQVTDNQTGEVLISEKVEASIEPEGNPEGDWKVRTSLAPRCPGISIFLSTENCEEGKEIKTWRKERRDGGN